MKEEACIFCGGPASAEKDEAGGWRFCCPVCGCYRITDLLHDRDPDVIRIAHAKKAAYGENIRRENKQGREPLFSNGVIVTQSFLTDK